MKQFELAKALGISAGAVSRLAKRGMPTDTLERAVRWRKRHLEPGRIKGQRFDPNMATATKPKKVTPTTTPPQPVAPEWTPKLWMHPNENEAVRVYGLTPEEFTRRVDKATQCLDDPLFDPAIHLEPLRVVLRRMFHVDDPTEPPLNLFHWPVLPVRLWAALSGHALQLDDQGIAEADKVGLEMGVAAFAWCYHRPNRNGALKSDIVDVAWNVVEVVKHDADTVFRCLIDEFDEPPDMGGL